MAGVLILGILAAGCAPTMAGPGGSGSGSGSATFSSAYLGVKLAYPSPWKPDSDSTETSPRYSGKSGFFILDGIRVDPGGSLAGACDAQAHMALKPYGSNPTVTMTRVQGQPTCMITPSPDEPEEMKGQAAAFVTYPNGTHRRNVRYEYLAVYADQGHLPAILSSLAFQ